MELSIAEQNFHRHNISDLAIDILWNFPLVKRDCTDKELLLL